MKLTQIAFFLSILLATSPIHGAAQSSEKVNNDVAHWMFKAAENNSAILWGKAIGILESQNTSEQNSLQLAYAYYGLTTAHLVNREKRKGKDAIELGLSYAKQLVKHPRYQSEAKAIMGGLYGLSIAFSPMKGMYLGPRSDKYIKQALEHDNNCAFAWLQKGSSLINTPRLFGGDPNESVEAFKRAVDLYSNSDSVHNWQKVESLVWLGQAYQKTNQKEKAIETYKLVLEEMPNYGWVKQILLPKALQSE